MSTPAAASTGVRLKTIALPAEHGGWAFLFEPILLGLAVAPSFAGGLIGLAALGAFLTRHPLKLALSDRRRGRRYPRTAWAERLALLYGLSAALAAGLALWLAAAPFWLPLLAAAPLALVQLAYDARQRGHTLVPELAGAVALGAVASAIALAGGWTLAPALALWLVLAARAAPAIVYVRARLRRIHGEEVSAAPALVVHAAGLALVTGLSAAGLAPWMAALALALLLARAAWGLAPGRKPVRATIIGVSEVLFGLVAIGLTALGYALSL